LLRSLLDRYETVIWIDCDAVICDARISILEVLDPSRPMHLVAHRYEGRVVPNTGVWVVRRTPEALELLEALWSCHDLVHHRWWENAALMEVIGFEVREDSCAYRGPTRYSHLVGFLGTEWNSIRQDRAPEPRIMHYPGESLERRTLEMQVQFGRFLATILRQPAGVPTAMPAGTLPAGIAQHEPAGTQPGTLGTVSRREDLPTVLNSLGLGGRGIEIGVKQGLFSEHLLRYWNCELLISVDPWQTDSAQNYLDIANVNQLQHESFFQETVQRLLPFGERSQIWRMTSLAANSRVADHSLDFAYIDARHDYASVLEDLTVWFGKVRPGGIIAGHDYLDGIRSEGDFGVKSAVDYFFAERGLQVHATLRDGPWLSWIVQVQPAGEKATCSEELTA
jgi:hypothetical protein